MYKPHEFAGVGGRPKSARTRVAQTSRRQTPSPLPIHF